MGSKADLERRQKEELLGARRFYEGTDWAADLGKTKYAGATTGRFSINKVPDFVDRELRTRAYHDEFVLDQRKSRLHRKGVVDIDAIDGVIVRILEDKVDPQNEMNRRFSAQLASYLAKDNALIDYFERLGIVEAQSRRRKLLLLL